MSALGFLSHEPGHQRDLGNDPPLWSGNYFVAVDEGFIGMNETSYRKIHTNLQIKGKAKTLAQELIKRIASLSEDPLGVFLCAAGRKEIGSDICAGQQCQNLTTMPLVVIATLLKAPLRSPLAYQGNQPPHTTSHDSGFPRLQFFIATNSRERDPSSCHFMPFGTLAYKRH